MNHWKEALKRKNVLFNLIFSYVCIGFVLIGVLSVVIINRVSEDVSRNLSKASEDKVHQSYYTADLLLTSTYNNFYNHFSKNEKILSAMYGHQFNTVETGAINQQLSDLIANNPLVYSLYVYNFRANTVFSTLNTTSSMEQFFDRGMNVILQQNKPYRLDYFIPRTETFKINDKTTEKNLITVVYSNLKSDGSMDAAMVVNLDQNVLQQLLNRGEQEKVIQTFIINEKGTVVSHDDSHFLNRNLKDRSDMERIMAASDKSGSFENQLDGKTYLTTYIKSDRLGWTFIGLADYDRLLAPIYQLKTFIIWVTVLFATIALGIAFFFTKTIYSPIYRLVHKLLADAPSVAGTQPIHELDVLARSFSALEEKIRGLQTEAVPAKKTEFLRALLQGTGGREQEDKSKWSGLGIQFPYDTFTSGVLRLDGYAELFGRYDLLDISLLKYGAGNIAAEVISPTYHVEVVDVSDDTLALLICTEDDGAESRQQMESMLRQITVYVKQYLKISVTAALGPSVNGAGQIKTSWSPALHMTQYRLSFGTGDLIPFAAETLMDFREYEYPMDLEKQMMDGVKSGEADKWREALTEFIDRIRENKFDEMMLALNQLVLVAERATAAMVDLSNDDIRYELESLRNKLRQPDSLEQFEARFVELCERTMSLRDQQFMGKTRKSVERILDYIHEHYTDPNLNLDILVEIVGLSTNYVRKIFKEQMGISVSQYITELRLQKAEEQLVRTSEPAKRIGELVGFENTSYFFVLFKKKYGKTPDHYRKDQAS
ncbi:helix-turn-helix domain-containing protein [Paenibacillus rigui]|uniref:HTH araC/xylS-type domain-containing protein n=1 Tax=Paenibacillus rigui TaxID=554312 RepID=A0A229UPI4_9BACL|nr:AraC family transcriptional regulator [Paenibacillus rigui]OXM85396.1 hypothetical protein CF651_15385 [Paenibacillus rigui]